MAMDLSKGKWIEPARHEEQTCAGTGTGLENVRRRLENAFPNRMRPKLLKKKVVFTYTWKYDNSRGTEHDKAP